MDKSQGRYVGNRVSLREICCGQGATLRPAGLPPGLRQSDCDGAADTFEDYSAGQLWGACAFAQQEALCRQFVAEQGDVFRDALMDDRINRGVGGAALLGSILRHHWIVFRDRGLWEMLCRGEIHLRT